MVVFYLLFQKGFLAATTVLYVHYYTFKQMYSVVYKAGRFFTSLYHFILIKL